MTELELIRELDRLWIKAVESGDRADFDAYEVLLRTVNRLMFGKEFRDEPRKRSFEIGSGRSVSA